MIGREWREQVTASGHHHQRDTGSRHGREQATHVGLHVIQARRPFVGRQHRCRDVEHQRDVHADVATPLGALTPAWSRERDAQAHRSRAQEHGARARRQSPAATRHQSLQHRHVAQRTKSSAAARVHLPHDDGHQRTAQRRDRQHPGTREDLEILQHDRVHGIGTRRQSSHASSSSAHNATAPGTTYHSERGNVRRASVGVRSSRSISRVTRCSPAASFARK